MKLKNIEISVFRDLIFNLKLKGKSNRLRVRLLELLDNRLELIRRDNLQLIEEFAERNSENDILYSDIEQTQPILKEGFNEELDKLANEYFYIETTMSNKDLLLNICDIFLDDNCDVEASGDMAILFDKWCNQCEEIVEFYNNLNN